MPRSPRIFLTLAALGLVGAAVAPAAIDSNPNTLQARLTGGAEAPTAGDSNGTGLAKINLNGRKNRICFAITFDGIARPNAGHIHKGARGVAGDVVVTLFDSSQSSPVRGCANNVPSSTIRQIRNGPRGFYVNLHNGPFSGGAIRGQLRQR
jgi:CHRD domain-containing protein